MIFFTYLYWISLLIFTHYCYCFCFDSYYIWLLANKSWTLFAFKLPYRIAVELLHNLAFRIYEVVYSQAALSIMRTWIVSYYPTGYTESTTNRRQHTGEDPALSVLDRFLRLVILLKYFLRTHPSCRWCTAPVIVRPISQHRPIVIRRIHLETDIIYSVFETSLVHWRKRYIKRTVWLKYLKI